MSTYETLKEYLNSDTAQNDYHYYVTASGVTQCVTLPLLVLVLGAFSAVELLDEVSEAPSCRHYYSAVKDGIRYRVTVFHKSN